MASEEGLKILLKGDAQDFVKSMKSGETAVTDVATAITKSVKSFDKLSASAKQSENDLDAETQAIRRAAQAVEDLGRRHVSIDEITEAIKTLRAEANRSDNFGILKEINREISLLEKEAQRLQGIGKLSFRVDNANIFSLLTKDINQSQAALKTFVTSAKQTEYQFNNLSKAGKGTDLSFVGLQKRTKDGTSALIGFGRIVQDAPYGIIGIGNNITQFAEQFQYLTKSTGSSGAAIKSIFASLAGAGGITLGISLLTTGLTVLAQKYGSLSNAIDALNPFLSNQEKAQNAVNRALVQGAAGASEEAIKMDLLFKAAKDLNIPLSERKKITDELIKQYPDSYGGLTAEAFAAGKADAAYQQLTKTLLAQATIRAGNEAIAEQGKELLQLRINAAKLDAELKALRDHSNDSFFGILADRGKQIEAVQNKINANKAKQNQLEGITAEIQKEQLKLAEQFGAKAFGIDTGKVTDISKVVAKLTIELGKVDEKANLTGESIKKVAQDKISLLSKAFDDIANIGGDKAKPALQDIGGQIAKLQPIADATSKKTRTISDVLRELQASLNATDAQAKLFGGTADKLAQEKLNALNKAFDDLVKLGLKPTSPELKKIADQINLISTSILGIKPLNSIFLQPLGKAIKTTNVKPLTPEELEKILGIKGDSQLFLEPKVKIEPIYQTTPALENVDRFSALFAAKMGKLGKDAQDSFKRNYIVWGQALTLGLTPAIVNVGAILQQGLSSAFSAVGEGLGKAIAGGGLSEVLGGIVGVMSEFIITFGKQLIEAGTLALIAQKSIIANPYLAIAAGIGAVAIGTALKNKVPAFATGGTVSGPTLAMIGDNPSGVEHVIPQEVLDRLGGGNGFIAETRLSGSDILVVVKRAGLNQNRING